MTPALTEKIEFSKKLKTKKKRRRIIKKKQPDRKNHQEKPRKIEK